MAVLLRACLHPISVGNCAAKQVCAQPPHPAALGVQQTEGKEGTPSSFTPPSHLNGVEAAEVQNPKEKSSLGQCTGIPFAIREAKNSAPA